MFADLPSQMKLFDAGWPDHERFPYKSSHFHVKPLVFQDLLTSLEPLIITGYTSLGMLLDYFELSQQQEPPLQSIRLMLGHEPTPTTRQDFTLKNVKFSQQFEDYWLEQGISLYKSAQVLLTMDLLQRKVIQVRIADNGFPLHAKIYKGDQAVTLGSSNFSQLGLMQQTEANVRFVLPAHHLSSSTTKKTKQQEAEEQAERRRFQEASQLAELLWTQGTDYTEQLLKLLEKLLHTVTWQDALARACAEVLEGTWAQQYTNEKLTFAAADSYRLAMRGVSLPDYGEVHDTILIPARTLNELARILPEEGMVHIIIPTNKPQVLFHTGTMDLTSRLISGTFPEFRRMVPQAYTTRAVIEVKELAAMVKSAIPFAPDASHIVHMMVKPGENSGLEPGTLTLQATTEGVGENVSTIHAAVDGPEQHIIFNAKYLSEYLAVLKTPTVALELISSTRPGVFKPVEMVDYTYVIMPMSHSQ